MYRDLDYILLNSGEVAITLGNWAGDTFRGRMTYIQGNDAKYEKVKFPMRINSKTGKCVLDMPADEHYVYSTSDVKEAYSPLDSFKNLSGEKLEIAEDILSIFERHGVKRDKSGLIGSCIIGNHNPNSDLDWVVYGQENLDKIKAAITTEFGPVPLQVKLPRFKKNIGEEYFLRFGFGKDQTTSMINKMWTFIWHKDHKVSLYFCDENCSPKIEEVARDKIEIKGTITDNAGSYFNPRIYGLNSKEDIAGIASWLFVYRNGVFEPGDQVTVRGRKCKVDNKPFILVEQPGEGIYS